MMSRLMSSANWVILAMAVLHTPAIIAQRASTNIVFKIGVFDRSSEEFAKGTPTRPDTLVIGQGDSSKGWHAIQPVRPIAVTPAPGRNVESSPRTIQFVLANVPDPVYRLRMAFLIESPCVPVIQVKMNDKRGRFYLHPKLDFSAGDMVNAFSPVYSSAEVDFTFPGTYLHRGVNTIELQAVEEQDILVPDASVTYDAIELSRNPEGLHFQSSTAEILPTIFYKLHDGKLQEIINVFIRNMERTKPGSSVDLTIDGHHLHEAFKGNQDFGDEKFNFAVPEFLGPTSVQLEWSVNGALLRKQQWVEPERKWTLYMVPHIHIDIGFSDYQAKVAALQSRVIDEAMDMIAQHPDFRFSVDGEWALEQFLKTRTPSERVRAMDAIKKQQLFVPAQYAILLTGFPTAETLIRSLYPSAALSREQGTPFDYANATDVPSYSWSYASILGSAGIKSFLAASDNYRAPVLYQGHLNESSPMWWQGPDGGKILLWYSQAYGQMRDLFGAQSQMSAGEEMLPLFIQQYKKPSYKANAAIIFGSQSENSDLFPQQAELAQQWNGAYEYPHLLYSGFHEALERVAQQFGNDLPTLRGEGASYWEDGIASDAFYAAMERKNEIAASSAEKLATVTSLVNPRIAADKSDLDEMWKNILLMDEHTWTSFNSVSDPTSMEAVKQLAVKELYAVKAEELADFVTRSSMASIADSISAGRGNLIVFNTLNWSRGGPVEVDINAGDEIVDSTTEQVIPMEVLYSGNAFRHVRFTAKSVPAMGYKVFKLRASQETALVVPPSVVRTTTLESPYYTVQLDPVSGAVRSIYDKEEHRELVNRKSPYKFGQYLYVEGGDKAPNSILQYREVSPKPKLDIHLAHDGHLVSVLHTPSGWSARMKCEDTNTPEITAEVLLFDHEKKIEFIEDVTKKEVQRKEAVYFAFPFGMDHPHFRYEIQTGVVDPAKDMYAGAGNEWFSVQHWVSVEQDGASATVMPLDAALVTLGDINRGAWPTQFGTRPGTVFSYAMNNYWDPNYRAGQGGHFRFRYVITSAHAIDPVSLSRMGWEEMTPLETNEIGRKDKALNSIRPLSGEKSEFLKVSDPNLVLEAWKPAEDENGTILRFLDFGDATRTVDVETPLLHLTEARQTDSVERDGQSLLLKGDGGFEFIIHPHEIVTVRITGKNRLQ